MNGARRSEREVERLYQASYFLPTILYAFHFEVFCHAMQFIAGNSEFMNLWRKCLNVGGEEGGGLGVGVRAIIIFAELLWHFDLWVTVSLCLQY